MEESKIGPAVTEGVKVAIQESLAPDIRALINELKHHTKTLNEQGQKLDDLADKILRLDSKQSRIITELKWEEKRVDSIEIEMGGYRRRRKVYPF